MIFGTPIPGYEAPLDGPTVEANRRMGEALFEVGIEAWRTGKMTIPALGRDVTDRERQLAAQIDPDLPVGLVPEMLDTWAHFHGVVTLEVLRQFDWIYGVDVGVFFEGEIDRLLVGLGAECQRPPRLVRNNRVVGLRVWGTEGEGRSQRDKRQ